MNYIELFAGCGGLSLGLKAAGFERLMANELSPMAAESFAYNLLNEDLAELAKSEEKPQNTLWINSNHPDLKSRLRENPSTFPAHNDKGFSDWPNNPSNLKGKLIVGSIIELNHLLEKNEDIVKAIQNGFDTQGGLDLVSGGPPCQSFSMAGLRERHNEKNTLPWEFAKFVKLTKPKVALLENVTGILRAFTDINGEKFHAWYEVAKTFAAIGYVPICLHINAKFAGVPQNRPRFIMIALRKDYFNDYREHLLSQKDPDIKLFDQSIDFFNLVQQHGESLPFGHLQFYDAQKEDHNIFFENSFLSPLIKNSAISVEAAIDDLKTKPKQQSDFVKGINKLFSNLKSEHSTIHNHEMRSHSPIIQRRFRIYQILQACESKSINNEVISILKGDVFTLSANAWLTLKNYKFLVENGSLKFFSDKTELELFLLNHRTKKQTQKALNSKLPAPAALSIPDDACHYDEEELRVLTVREMARIQSFPDNFIFRSKVTTGGQMRKFEVPQYTQVGNAVPPLLGYALGEVLKNIFKINRHLL